MSSLLEWSKVAEKVALEAGAMIAQAFYQRHPSLRSPVAPLSQQDVSSNSTTQTQHPTEHSTARKEENDANLVTETDKAVEEFCFSSLRKVFPTHVFIGEEESSLAGLNRSSSRDKSQPTWIIDPIDGTTNFVHGFPYLAVSIGLVINSEPVIGIIYNPILNDLYSAVTGHGAFWNRQRIQRINRPLAPFSQSVMACEFGNERTNEILDPKLRTIEKLIKTPVRGLRSVGAATMNMCLVARGILDIYFEAGVHSWDITAGIVILREAGGLVGNFSSQSKDEQTIDILDRTIIAIRPGDSIQASQKRLLEIQSLLEPIPYERDN